LAARQGSRVVAVHAIDPLLAEAAASLSGAARLKADAQAELEALCEAERKRVPGLPAVTSIVRVGPAAREILASTRDSAAALVVMGTQGLGGIRKLFFGSIAEKVLRDAAVPVLAVPLPESAGAGPARDSEAGVPEIQIVIASVELDASAEAVIGHAVSFARGFGLPVMLLHVVPPVDRMPRALEAARAAERLHETNAQVRLAELADEPFVFYSRPSGPAVYDTIVGFCLAAGYRTRIEQEAADVQTIMSLVAAGLGVSLLISPTPPSNPDAVVYRELSDDLPPWPRSVAWSPDNRSPVLERFLELI